MVEQLVEEIMGVVSQRAQDLSQVEYMDLLQSLQSEINILIDAAEGDVEEEL